MVSELPDSLPPSSARLTMEPQDTRPHAGSQPHILSPAATFSSPSSPQATLRNPQQPQTAISTPASSPGMFSPASSPGNLASPSNQMPESTVTSPGGPSTSTYLPLHPVRETHTATVDRDYAGRKTINEYQVLEEIGRGQHGKVKLARDSVNGHLVAIKIIPRLSKTRRLGKVSAVDPQQNTKREIAILKKIRHENVVALLEVIDDPELRKIYMVLENVERGEIVWRKKGLPNICYFERYRIEKGRYNQTLAPGEVNWQAVLERKAAIHQLKEARDNDLPPPVNRWTTEFGITADDDDQPPWWYVADNGPVPEPAAQHTYSTSRNTSRAPSRVASSTSVASNQTTRSYGSEPSPLSVMAQDGDAGCELRRGHGQISSTALDGSMYGPYYDEPLGLRHRSPSVANSIFSNMSGIDYNAVVHDPFADDFSYVPCFSIERARSAFRDTVLGLEYLHYHGVVHRDIKPANLLWTRDFHVKISDFGVSYFGRPIRDGEQDDAVSEAEALDFDDDRELSKTVGTPAFFAPELCYTDLDKEPPKVSEQIDVWSLGVTLYCLIYARIPFLAEDEFSMFRKIATEEVYIPDRRLKPVGVFTDPTGSSLYERTNPHPSFRSDADLDYEQLADPLLDLLKKMLVKNPEQRIRLRDVKRHLWVTEDIENLPSWLEKTDPARNDDRRIQVNDNEIGVAVVPLNFLQRARSAMKRAVGKVIHVQSRDDSVPPTPSRRGATSSPASSVGEVPPYQLPGLHDNVTGSGGHHNLGGSTHHLSLRQHNHNVHQHHHHHHGSTQARDGRRGSLRGDDYFATITQLPTDHPLSQSQAASPFTSPGDNTPNSELVQQPMPAGEVSEMPPWLSAASVDGCTDPAPTSTTVHTTTSRPISRHVHSRSITNAFLGRAAAVREAAREVHTVPTTPAGLERSLTPAATSQSRSTRDMLSSESSSRSQSVDRGGIIFSSVDKRASPVVGLNPTYAPGCVQQPRRSDQLDADTARCGGSARSDITTIVSGGSHGDMWGSEDELRVPAATTPSSPLASPQFFSSAAASSYHHGQQPMSDSNIVESQRAVVKLDERPATAHRVHDSWALETSIQIQPKPVLASRPGSSLASNIKATGTTDAASIPCPPSPLPKSPRSPKSLTFASQDQYSHEPQAVSGVRDNIPSFTATSSNSTSADGLSLAPATSTSDTTNLSSVSTSATPCKDSTNPMLTFQSDPSLPALLSGASSVSADVEGDYLGNPGVVGSSLVEAAVSLTPPAMNKDAVNLPLDHVAGSGLKGQPGWDSGGTIPIDLDGKASKQRPSTPTRSLSSTRRRPIPEDDDDDSGSDGGIVMAKPRRRGGALSRDATPITHGGRVQQARRRDTNTSIGSTDTAKKVSMQGE